MITAKDLLEELQDIVDIGKGHLPVYVYADHGQEFIQSVGASVELTTDSGYEYTLEGGGVHPDDERGYELEFVCIGD